MDHEALEAELKRVEARAKARRQHFDAAIRGPELEEPSPWRRHQVKVLAVILASAAGIAFLHLTQLASPARGSGPAANGVEAAAVAGAEGGGSGRGAKSPTGADDTPRDPIEDLFHRIQRRKFLEAGEVAVGPFLRDFGEEIKKVDEIDIAKLRPRRRGLTWTVVLAPFKTDVEPWERPKPGGSVEVRCVKGSGVWRIEQLVPIRGADA